MANVIITNDESIEIVELKNYLHQYFQNKKLVNLKSFLRIEVARLEESLYISCWQNNASTELGLTCFDALKI